MAESFGPFTWSDPFLLEEQLTDEERAVLSTAREYAQAKLMPRILLANRHEVFDREILHDKTLIYDRVLTIVGSSNLDPRSFDLNYELSVLVVGARFADPVVRFHDEDLAASEAYTLDAWRARPFWTKLGDWFWSLLRRQL